MGITSAIEMIAEELKKIREAEDKAKSIVEHARVDSKEKVESAKKNIQIAIAHERRDVMSHGEEIKKKAEEDALKEAEAVRSEYHRKAKEIQSIDDERIGKVAKEIIDDLLR